MKLICSCGKSFWPQQKWQHESCVELAKVIEEVKAMAKPQDEVFNTPPRAKPALASAETVSQLASQLPLASTTYKHRDAEKRREYQRDLMRSRRRAARRVSA